MRHDTHEEICLLLPWYLNNTLERSERDMVSHHLADCTQCNEQLTLLSSVQAAMAKSSPTPIVPAPDLARLFESIDREEVASKPAPMFRRAHVVMTSLVAALAVVVIFGIYRYNRPESPARYSTATSETGVAGMEYVLEVNFEVGTDVGAREQFFREIGARDVIETSLAGHYQATVNLQIASLEDLRSYTDNLESLPAVKSVEVLALHLPIRASE